MDTKLPLKPDVFLILMILIDGASHGYAIIKEAAARTRRTVPWPCRRGNAASPSVSIAPACCCTLPSSGAARGGGS